MRNHGLRFFSFFFSFLLVVSLVHALSAPVSATDGCQYSTEAQMGKMIFESTIGKAPTDEKEYTIKLWKYRINGHYEPGDPVNIYFSEYTWCHKNAWDIIREYEALHSGPSLRKEDFVGTINGRAMKTYAKRWAKAKDRNPGYPYFPYADCTNFASQILHAGGVPMVFDGNVLQQWYVKKKEKLVGNNFPQVVADWEYSSSWVNVDDFREHIVKRNIAVIVWDGKIKESFSSYDSFSSFLDSKLPGGVGYWQVDLHPGGGPDHTVFLFKDNGKWHAAYHTRDICEPLEELWNAGGEKEKLFTHYGKLIRLRNVR